MRPDGDPVRPNHAALRICELRKPFKPLPFERHP